MNTESAQGLTAASAANVESLGALGLAAGALMPTESTGSVRSGQRLTVEQSPRWLPGASGAGGWITGVRPAGPWDPGAGGGGSWR